MSKHPTVFIIAPYCTILHLCSEMTTGLCLLFINHQARLKQDFCGKIFVTCYMASDALAGCTVARCCTAGTHLHHEPLIGKMAMEFYGSNVIKTSIYIHNYNIYDNIFFDDPRNLYDSWSFTLTMLMITRAAGFQKISMQMPHHFCSGSNTKIYRSPLVVHLVFVWREVLISDGKRCFNGLKDTIRYLWYSLSNIQNLNKNNLLVASEF